MKLTILGTGTCVPESDRCQASYYLQTEKNSILFDIGGGALHRIAQAGIDYMQIDTICLTHLHCDHMADLIPFLFSTRENPFRQRSKPLLIIGPPETEKMVNDLLRIYGHWKEPSPYKMKCLELENDTFDLNGEELKILNMQHGEKANGYRLTDNSGKTPLRLQRIPIF